MLKHLSQSAFFLYYFFPFKQKPFLSLFSTNHKLASPITNSPHFSLHQSLTLLTFLFTNHKHSSFFSSPITNSPRFSQEIRKRWLFFYPIRARGGLKAPLTLIIYKVINVACLETFHQSNDVFDYHSSNIQSEASTR